MNAGFENHSASEIVRGYHLLTGVRAQFPDDAAVLSALGRAYLAIHQPQEATGIFERVLELGPDSALNEADAGEAWMRAGQMDKAAEHLERAIRLDPLLLPAAEALANVYRARGDEEKMVGLTKRVRQALGSSAPQDSGDR